MNDQSPFPLVAAELRRCIDAALPKLLAIPASDTHRAPAPGKWSPAQVVGHLIDSAANNHQRFVRAQETSALVFPPYAQDHWVKVQHYEDRSWDDLVNFWHAYNRHLAHVIEHIPEDRRSVPVTLGANAPVTVGYLAHDYVVHMCNHLRQMGVSPDPNTAK